MAQRLAGMIVCPAAPEIYSTVKELLDVLN
jgi:hypothetical protein